MDRGPSSADEPVEFCSFVERSPHLAKSTPRVMRPLVSKNAFRYSPVLQFERIDAPHPRHGIPWCPARGTGMRNVAKCTARERNADWTRLTSSARPGASQRRPNDTAAAARSSGCSAHPGVGARTSVMGGSTHERVEVGVGTVTSARRVTVRTPRDLLVTGSTWRRTDLSDHGTIRLPGCVNDSYSPIA